MDTDWVARSTAIVAAAAAILSLVWRVIDARHDRPVLRAEIDRCLFQGTGPEYARARVWNNGKRSAQVNSVAIWLGPPPWPGAGWLVRWVLRSSAGSRRLHRLFYRVQLEPDFYQPAPSDWPRRLDAMGDEAFAWYDITRLGQELNKHDSRWVMYARAIGPTSRAMSRPESRDFLAKPL